MVVEALTSIAPELRPEDIHEETDLRNDLDLDSMDLLNFAIALSRSLKIEIPDADYGELATPAACVRYVQAHLRP
jgi:acyl carrier protein